MSLIHFRIRSTCLFLFAFFLSQSLNHHRHRGRWVVDRRRVERRIEVQNFGAFGSGSRVVVVVVVVGYSKSVVASNLLEPPTANASRLRFCLQFK